MSNNFFAEFEKQAVQYKGSRLLLHCCCAPCSSATVELLQKYFDVTLYFYNPNIMPYEEYEYRANELIRFAKEFCPQTNVVIADYDEESFLKIAKGKENLPEKSQRCYDCYKLRIDNAAKYAKDNGYECFTTTLSISPHKNAEWINNIGKEAENKYGTIFISSDFKKKEGYKRSITLSNEYNLYRQNYCGCKYSKRIDK